MGQRGEWDMFMKSIIEWRVYVVGRTYSLVYE